MIVEPTVKKPIRKNLPRTRVVRDIVQGSVPAGKLRDTALTVANTKNADIGGGVKYGTDRKSIVAMLVPDGNNAYDTTVRGHETRHATFTKKEKRDNAILTQQRAMARQIVEDDFIEQKPLPARGIVPPKTLLKYKRRAIATAMRDVREALIVNRRIARGEIPNDAGARNAKLLSAVRADAMLGHYGKRESYSDYTEKDLRTDRQVSKARSIIRTKILGGDKTLIQGMDEIIKLAEKPRTKGKAVDLLTLLQETQSDEKPRDREEEYTGRPPTEPIEDMPVGPENEMGNDMVIIELRPRQTATVKTRTTGLKYAPNGVLLNPNRYVSAIVSGDANGLFRRRTRAKIGGTVLIDASGSMGANHENLSELCRAMPTATVAYYSGNRGVGHLCVYARDGKRYDGPIKYKHGGNDIDLLALQWLMRQPKPWIFVTDMQFTGGKTGQAEMTHAIVRRLVKRGDLKIIPSFMAAFEEYGNDDQKRKMREAAYARGDSHRAQMAAENVARRLPDWLRDALDGTGGKIIPLKRGEKFPWEK